MNLTVLNSMGHRLPVPLGTPNMWEQDKKQNAAASRRITALPIAVMKSTRIVAKKVCFLLFLEHNIRHIHVSQTDLEVPSTTLG